MSEAGRLERVRARLDALGVDALLITAPANRRWVSDFTGSTGTVLVSAQAARIAIDGRYTEQAATQCPLFEPVASTRDAAWEQAAAILAGLGGQRVGFEAANLPYAEYEAWTHAMATLPSADRPALVPTVEAIEALRAVKDATELVALATAVRIADEAFLAAVAEAHEGMTERELAWAVQRHAMEQGADALSFPTIIASGAWGALPHAYPRDVPLGRGHGVVMDLGVVVDGYCSDLTRTIYLGAPDARFREVYDIVLAAQEMAEERIEAGMTGQEAHAIAETVIAAAGYGDRFTHGLGHGVGLEIHESPRLRPESDDVLIDGHVLTIEPGIYIPGWGGVRIEDQCVMEHGRLRPLTAAPKRERPESLARDGRLE